MDVSQIISKMSENPGAYGYLWVSLEYDQGPEVRLLLLLLFFQKNMCFMHVLC